MGPTEMLDLQLVVEILENTRLNAEQKVVVAVEFTKKLLKGTGLTRSRDILNKILEFHLPASRDDTKFVKSTLIQKVVGKMIGGPK